MTDYCVLLVNEKEACRGTFQKCMDMAYTYPILDDDGADLSLGGVTAHDGTRLEIIEPDEDYPMSENYNPVNEKVKDLAGYLDIDAAKIKPAADGGLIVGESKYAIVNESEFDAHYHSDEWELEAGNDGVFIFSQPLKKPQPLQESRRKPTYGRRRLVENQGCKICNGNRHIDNDAGDPESGPDPDIVPCPDCNPASDCGNPDCTICAPYLQAQQAHRWIDEEEEGFWIDPAGGKHRNGEKEPWKLYEADGGDDEFYEDFDGYDFLDKYGADILKYSKGDHDPESAVKTFLSDNQMELKPEDLQTAIKVYSGWLDGDTGDQEFEKQKLEWDIDPNSPDLNDNPEDEEIEEGMLVNVDGILDDDGLENDLDELDGDENDELDPYEFIEKYHAEILEKVEENDMDPEEAIMAVIYDNKLPIDIDSDETIDMLADLWVEQRKNLGGQTNESIQIGASEEEEWGEYGAPMEDENEWHASDDIDISGTSYQGHEISTSFNQLVELFGKPQFNGSGNVHVQWSLIGNAGYYKGSIYDYKENISPAEHPDETFDWHLGAFTEEASRSLLDYINKIL